MIKIFNTITKKKENLKIIDNNINIYVCGVTVYSLCHVGHARTFIFFDMIIRYLKYYGYNLKYVRNITDIDDKIIFYANKNHDSIANFTLKMINNMYEDFNNLNLIKPNYEPKVTDHIKEIINFIQHLISKNCAYVAKNGDVMFSIKNFKYYGQLSSKKIKQKKDIYSKKDFVLWKLKKIGEPSWSSPWGHGRPGWHIECSAISYKYFGKNIDIHGGGSDLIFPHHENERAQSYCAHKQIIRYWMHIGIIKTNDGKKMSKSLNNFFTIRDILNIFDAEVLRYFFMSSHYRSSIVFSELKIKKSQYSLESLYNSLIGTDLRCIPLNNTENKHYEKIFKEAMNDDFNTPIVYSILFEMMHKINKLKNKNINLANNLAAKLRQLGNVIGLLKQNPENFFKKNIKNKNIEKINFLVKMRLEARKQKQWNKADEIRKTLEKMGIYLEDQLNKTIWKIK